MAAGYEPIAADRCSDDSGEDASEAEPPRRGPRSRLRRFGVSLLLASPLLAAAGFAILKGAGSGAGRQQLRRGDGLQVKQQLTWVQGYPFSSHAPKMDVDVEYKGEGEGGWGTNYDHIPSPEMCAGMCQGVMKCQAYVWVKNAGLDGCPSQCWLKDSVGKKANKTGLVSGVPPDRVAFGDVPSASCKLYCFALMVPDGYEEGLLKWQHENKAGIFGCAGQGVYSNKHIHVAGNIVSHVVNSSLKCGYGGDSFSALNAWIFIAVWQKVFEVGDYKAYDWVVKVDPDTVFFPHRLCKMLHGMEPVGYINNCKYGMHGPIEVFSTSAIKTLAEDYRRSWDGRAPKQCVDELHFGQWGEDMFVDQCLNRVLQVTPRPLMPKLMCESHCDCPAWFWCNNGPDVVSYHPFKSVESYKNCMANALAGEPKPTFMIAPKKDADDEDAKEDADDEDAKEEADDKAEDS